MSFAGQVVERCPRCGVEHDLSDTGACDACGTALRYWCRRHGREAGWLAGPACPRCAEEAARPRPAMTALSAGAVQPRARPPLVRRGVERVPGRALRGVPTEPPGEAASKGSGTGGSRADIVWLLVLCVFVGVVMGVIVGSEWNARADAAGDPLMGGLVGSGVGLLVAWFVCVVILVSRVRE